jgi:hypothetical protein
MTDESKQKDEGVAELCSNLVYQWGKEKGKGARLNFC